MVKMLLDMKLSMKCINFLNFLLAGMEVCLTAVRSNTFPDCV